jgi:hypothetical protein
VKIKNKWENIKEMWKYDVEERIKKLSCVYKEKTFKEFDEYKSEISCLFS